MMADIATLPGQPCPMCGKSTLTLTETDTEVPYFGKVYLFSMTCSTCKYHKSDVETAEIQKPSKYSIDITSKDDLNIRIVKSASATVKIPHIGTIEPGASANGYVTNVEGILQRMKEQIEQIKETEEDDSLKKK